MVKTVGICGGSPKCACMSSSVWERFTCMIEVDPTGSSSLSVISKLPGQVVHQGGGSSSTWGGGSSSTQRGHTREGANSHKLTYIDRRYPLLCKTDFAIKTEGGVNIFQ